MLDFEHKMKIKLWIACDVTASYHGSSRKNFCAITKDNERKDAMDGKQEK